MRPPDFSRENLFGGRGRVSIWNLTPNLSPFTALLWCSLSSHGRVGPHRQERDPEVIVCISGTGHIWINKVKHIMEPMNSYALPLGAILAIENTAEEPLVYSITKAQQTAQR